ncbi:hypothetical protein PENSPDRAFT_162232 [Peniophora sp. CONT]|nr:hypothetical protein PENSPDRAFT_162232 [Peniophora sp. CONT]
MLRTSLHAACRAATSSARASVHHAPRVAARSLSTTPRRLSDMPDRDEFMKRIGQTGVFKQINEKNPAAATAIADLYEVLKESGVEFKPRQLPSKLQMMKLAMNRKFITAFKACVVELEKAGIDFKSEDVMEKVMSNLHLEHEAHTKTDEALRKQAESKKVGGS